MKPRRPKKTTERTGAPIGAPPITVRVPVESLIDGALLHFTGRGLITASEVVDVLLDLRSRIAPDAAIVASDDEAPAPAR